MQAYFSYDDDLLRRIMFLILLMMPSLIIIGRSPLDVAATVIAVCFLIYSLYWKDFNWLKSQWVIAALCFWLFTVFNSLQAFDVSIALKRSLPYIRFPIFAIAVSYWIIRREQDLKLFVYAFLATLAFSVADGLFEYIVGVDFAGNPRIPGRLSGPFEISTLGTFLTKMGIPIMLAFFAFAPIRNKLKYTALSFSFIMVVTILMAGERMAILLLVFSMFIVALINKHLRKYVLILSILLVSVYSCFVYFDTGYMHRTINSTVQQIQMDPSKSNNYLAQFDAALEIIRDHPLFGTGANNYRIVCTMPKYDPRPNGQRSRCLIHPHHVYLELLANNGLIGGLLFSLIIFYWCKLWWRYKLVFSKDFLLFGSSLGVLLFLFPFSVGMSIFSNFNGILFWLMVAFMLSSFQQKTNLPYSINNNNFN